MEFFFPTVEWHCVCLNVSVIRPFFFFFCGVLFCISYVIVCLSYCLNGYLKHKFVWMFLMLFFQNSFRGLSFPSSRFCMLAASIKMIALSDEKSKPKCNKLTSVVFSLKHQSIKRLFFIIRRRVTYQSCHRGNFSRRSICG